MGYEGVAMNADLPHADTVTANLMTIEMPPVCTTAELVNGEIKNVKQVNESFVPKEDGLVAMTFVTQEELQDMKDQINSSFEEIANLYNELLTAITFINERLTLFNTKAGHKI